MTIFLVALVVTFSGFINSLTGFGFIIVAAAFLAQLLPPKDAASLALVLGIILAGIVALRERKTIAMKITLFIQNNTGWNNNDGHGAVTYLINSGNAENITISNCTFLGNRSLSS
jgi:tetrahydromethanopterin S-methyltransferase subunit C